MGRVEIDLRELSREVDNCRVLYFRSILYRPLLHTRSPMRNTVSKVSHNLWRPIKEGEGQLNVIITISGTTKVFLSGNEFFCKFLNVQANSPSNLANWNPHPKWEQDLEERYVSSIINNKQIIV